MGVQAVFGGEMAWYSEIDKGALKILTHRFPDVPNIGDITAVDWSTVEPVDILTGGSPCQDLSHAGKRAGMTEGTRSNLWVAMREAIAQLRPRLVIWENVRGAYSAEADSDLGSNPRLLADTRRRDGEPVLRALGRVLGDLSDLGYVGGWHGLRAADIGAPHGRFRVFVVAYPQGDAGRIEHRDGSPATDAERGGRDGWAPNPWRSALGRTALEGAVTGPLLPSPRTSDTNGAGHHGQGGLDLRTAISLLPTPMVGSTSPAAHGQISGQYRAQMAEAFDRWGDYGPAIRRWEQITRPAPAPKAPGRKGIDQLTAAFSEWMMGLPAGHVTDVPGITRNEALKALGNGVVPQQAEAAIRWLLARVAVAA
jgi:DNA (cytosine-5)-methyltransferase 1